LDTMGKVISKKSRKDALAKMLLKLVDEQRAAKRRAHYTEFEGVKRLTDRHIQITKLLLDGYSYLEIANELSLATNTVRCHAKRIYVILRVKGRRTLYSELSEGEIALVRKRFEEIGT
jgi:ATP/maltotriose-dependent transcriptional regulator MalT